MNTYIKILSVLIGLSLIPLRVQAEETAIHVKGISTQRNETTAITIRKKKPHPAKKAQEPEFTIVKGEREVEGDPSASVKGALQNWKTACSEWKEEIKELNKANEVLVLDCGKPVAGKADYHQKIYQSNGSYQIKVRMKSKAELERSSAITDDEEDEDEDDDESPEAD